MIVLVAMDFSDVARPTLDTVKGLLASKDHTIYLVHVAEPDPEFVGYDAGPDVVRDQVAAEFHREHRDLESMAAELKDAGINATPLLIQGPFVQTILDEAAKLNADMIVVGSHGHGATYDLLVGSISAGVIRKANIPVLVVPSRKG